MRAYELNERTSSKPCIVVDVQPEYTGVNDGNELPWIDELMEFLNGQSGPILMFVNAEQDGLSGDTANDIKLYWEDSGFDPGNWNRVQIVDKGYGYFRAWMDEGVPEASIIKTIRLMYQNKVTDSRQLFGGEYEDDYVINMEALGIPENMLSDPLSVEWTSVSQLKKFNGAYIMGGGKNECLREVELLMNAFNIKYREVREFIY
jgi:hypothetical protein